jgi:hypothetical protein
MECSFLGNCCQWVGLWDPRETARDSTKEIIVGRDEGHATII